MKLLASLTQKKPTQLRLGFPYEARVRHLHVLASQSAAQKEQLKDLAWNYFYSLWMSAGELSLIGDPIHQRK